MALDKDTVLFSRDEKGELIPQKVKVVIDESDEEQLKYKDETVSVIPIPRGQLKRMFATALKDDESDLDGEIISKFCANPKFSLEETTFIKPPFNSIIVDTILTVSGVNRQNSKQSHKDMVDVAEDDFAKN